MRRPARETNSGMRPTLVSSLLVVLAGCHEDPLVSAYSLEEEEAAVACTAGVFELTPVTPEVMLVLDRSQSMSASFGDGSRWSTVVSALEVALPSVDEEMALGLTLFPATGVECAAPASPELLPATRQVSALLSELRVSTLVGGTPTADALDVAAAGLIGSGPRAMVLATDGLPNCNSSLSTARCSCPSGSCNSAVRCIDDARTLDRLSEWSNAGIPTWVIGIGGDVTGSALLDAMAVAGGRPAASSPKYLSALSVTELRDAFIAIRDELSACSFTSPSVPDAGGSIVVMLDGEAVPRDASGADGWTWSSETRGELSLRGSWCAKAIASGSGVLRVSVTCAAVDGGQTPAIVQ